MKLIFFSIISTIVLTSCALSPTEFHCKADAGLGCHRLDEVNAWVEQGIFDESGQGQRKGKQGKHHVVYIHH